MCACAQVCKQYVSLNKLDVGASPLGGRVIKHMQALTVHYAVSVPLPPTPQPPHSYMQTCRAHPHHAFVQSPLHSPHTQTYASLYSPHTSTCCTQLLWRLCVFQPRVGPHLLVTWRLCTRADTHGQEGERDEKHGRREYKKKRQRTGNGPEREANGRASGLGHRHRYSALLMSTGCRRRGV